jgi:hypothetical protein
LIGEENKNGRFLLYLTNNLDYDVYADQFDDGGVIKNVGGLNKSKPDSGISSQHPNIGGPAQKAHDGMQGGAIGIGASAAHTVKPGTSGV